MTHPVYNVVDNDAKDGFTFEKKIAFINFFSSQFPFMLSIQLFVAALSLSLSLTTTKLFVHCCTTIKQSCSTSISLEAMPAMSILAKYQLTLSAEFDNPAL